MVAPDPPRRQGVAPTGSTPESDVRVWPRLEALGCDVRVWPRLEALGCDVRVWPRQVVHRNRLQGCIGRKRLLPMFFKYQRGGK